MRPIESLQDLIDEAKLRTVWWAICVFFISYFLSHTSKSMWTNIPMSIIILSIFRYLHNKVELRWKAPPVRNQSNLSRLVKRQSFISRIRPLATPSASGWRQKIDSALVEGALESLVDHILRDFVLDLWYSNITPDKEGPKLIRSSILNALGEVSRRVKEMNLVDLLTREMVDLIGSHLEIYRRHQNRIGIDVLGTLSFEQRDEEIKQQLIACKELHPALISKDYEYKVLQHISDGVLANVLGPQDAQSPLVRCLSRELLTCFVLQPVMNFASPSYINELIVHIFADKDNSSGLANSNNSVKYDNNQSPVGYTHGHQMEFISSQSSDLNISSANGSRELATSKDDRPARKDPQQADWAIAIDAATSRRSQVLAPENLDNMWTKGTHYQKKSATLKGGHQSGAIKSSEDVVAAADPVVLQLDSSLDLRETPIDDKYMVDMMSTSKSGIEHTMNAQNIAGNNWGNSSMDVANVEVHLKQSSSLPSVNTPLQKGSETNGLSAVVSKQKDEHGSATGLHSDVSPSVKKIKCKVDGAYFDKMGSSSFAVYKISVTDADNRTWFVERRYSNFVSLHQRLKEIPNYSLHLPPKSYLSSSVDNTLVRQRCIHFDKYLQNILSIPNIAEQHEVMDFLSASSKNYSFAKSTRGLKPLAVNMDVVRQMGGSSNELGCQVVGTTPSSMASSQMAETRMTQSLHVEVANKQRSTHRNYERSRSLSDDETRYDDRPSSLDSGWHSDDETNSRGLSTRLSLDSERLGIHTRSISDADLYSLGDPPGVPPGMPPEWTPPHVSVPLLNLVDKIFQIKRRGWLRRQVFWVSKQILQLVMEDAIDEWILRQINMLRRDDLVARGIGWVQDVLWPNGVFFARIDVGEGSMGGSQSAQYTTQNSQSSSFEVQLEASRRQRDVKKLLLDATPPALVKIIGQNQYQRSSRDVYYFLQSSICVKQLAYAMLEIVLKYLFPDVNESLSELRNQAYMERPKPEPKRRR